MTETTDGFPSAWDNLVHTIYGLRDGHRLTSDVLTAVVLYRDEETQAAKAATLREAADAAVSDGDDCVPWDADHDRATVSVWLQERAARIPTSRAVVVHGFEPGRWWRAWTEDGGLWMESSDEQEVRDGCPAGGKVQRLWVCEYEPLEEWRDA